MRFSLLFHIIPICAGLCVSTHGPVAIAQEQEEATPAIQSAKAPANLSKPTSAAWAAVFPQYEAELARDPQNAVKQLRAFIAANPQIKAGELMSVYEDAATRLVGNSPNNLDTVIALLEEGQTRVAGDLDWARLTSIQGLLLRQNGRLDQSEALFSEAWPKALSNKTSVRWRRGLMRQYVGTLLEQKKGDAGEQVLMEALAVSPIILNELGRDFYYDMTRLKEAQGTREQQLNWAALTFRMVPFEEGGIGYATRKLTQAWVGDDLNLDVSRAFALAQTDANAPNPLLDVVLPVWPEPVQQAFAVMAQEGGVNAKVTALLALQRWGEAMLAAREGLVTDPTSTLALQQVARVFKAADADVARANAFISYYNSGTGENPMDAFLAEHPVKSK